MSFLVQFVGRPHGVDILKGKFVKNKIENDKITIVLLFYVCSVVFLCGKQHKRSYNL